MGSHIVTEHETELWDKYQKNNKPESVRNEIIMLYDDYIKWLCAMLYKKHYSNMVAVWEDDLYQIAVIEGLKIVESYDHKKAEFLTHISFMLPKRLWDYIRCNSPVRRSHMKRYMKKIDIEDEMKNDDSEENLQNYMKLDDKQFRRFLRLSHVPGIRKLSEEIQGKHFDDISDLSHFIACPNTVDPLDAISRKDMQEHILRKIPKEYRMAVKLYFFTTLTMDEIGQSMGYSESRISQKIKLAMQILPSEISRQFFETE